MKEHVGMSKPMTGGNGISINLNHFHNPINIKVIHVHHDLITLVWND